MGSIHRGRSQNLSNADLSLSDESRNLRRATSVIQPYSPHSSNQWLGDFVGTSRLIGIGEPTHGTADCFKAQATLAKQLIAEHNVCGVYIELPPSSAVRALTAASAGREAVREVIEANRYPTWMNQEILDLIMYVHAWNGAHPYQQVHCTGLDCQDSDGARMLSAIETAHPSVRDWARQVSNFAPVFLPSSGLLGMGAGWSTEDSVGSMGVAERQGVTFPKEAHTLIESGQRLRYLVNSGSLQSDLMEGCLSWLQLAEEHLRAHNAGEPASSSLRDTLMASRVERLLKHLQPDQKAIVLAHNAHVAFGLPGDFAQGMGAALKARLGSNYKAILTTTDGGFVRSHRTSGPSSEVCSLAFPPRISHESAFRSLSNNPFMFRVDRASEDPMYRDSVRELKPMRCMGYRYSSEVSEQFKPVVLADQCDGVIFFPHSRASGFDSRSDANS